MTRGEAEGVLWLIDQLRERGALVVDVCGVKANFATTPTAAPAERGKKEKTYHERLFRHLNTADKAPPTRAERLKRPKATEA